MSRSKATLWMMLTTLLTVITLLMLPHTPAVPVRTILVERGEWMRTAHLSGTVKQETSPCVSLKNGIVRTVCVSPGTPVRKGDLLFVMDTSAEEQMLSAMKRAQYAQRDLPAQAEAFAAMREVEWLEAEMRLQNTIEAAQIRAPMDGVLEQVFVKQGEPVKEASLMGYVAGKEKRIMVTGSAEVTSTLKADMPALLCCEDEMIGTAVLETAMAPDENGIQQLTLRPLDQSLLQRWTQGRELTVEWETESLADRALIPISAVDEQGKVWVIEKGRAYACPIDISSRNEESIAADIAWEGKRIVLEPEGLYEGCRVKEATLP